MTTEDSAHRIVILDFEASCAPGDGRRSYPVEVAAGLPETGEIRIWLIKPERDWLDAWDWYYEAEKLHRLTRDHLLAQGLPRAQVARELSAFIGEREVVSDCPPAEGHWLAVLFGEAQPRPVGALGALLEAIAGGGLPGRAPRWMESTLQAPGGRCGALPAVPARDCRCRDGRVSPGGPKRRAARACCAAS